MLLLNVLLSVAVLSASASFILMLLSFIKWKRSHVGNYTEPSRAICRAAFGEELPKSFVVFVSDAPARQTDMERTLGGTYVLGTCDPEFKVIELYRNRLAYCEASEWKTIVHECLHALQPNRRHDNDREKREFQLLVDQGMRNLWKEVNRAELQAE